MTRHPSIIAGVFALACACLALPTLAQDSEEGRGSDQGGASGALGASTDAFFATDGEEIYMTACSGCHQPQGQGAVGAGQYPPLAANPVLEGGRYPAWIIINGVGGMPSFADWLDNEQVVAVVRYLQQNLGNDYDSDLTVEDVEALREDQGWDSGSDE